MKRTYLLMAVMAIIVSCKNASKSTEADSPVSDTSLAYTKAHPGEWQWGSQENLKTALAALKAYEKGDLKECVSYFADSATLEFDGYEGKLPKDSLVSFFEQGRKGIKNFKVNMDDYESVKSKDGKYEYVSLWYKQIAEMENGEIDSVECMNDIRLENGKIITLNEKTRHYPAKRS